MTSILRNSYISRTAADDFFCRAFPGYRLESFTGDITGEELVLNLLPIQDPQCPCCGNLCPKVHSTEQRSFRCAPLVCATHVTLKMPLRRVLCLNCGCKRTEVINWICPKYKCTNRLIAEVQLKARSGMTNAAIARELNLSWDTVKRFDKLQLEYIFAKPDFHGVKHLIMDEFAVHKGQDYATVIMDADTHRVIWVCEGKSRDAVRPFFEAVKEQGLECQIESVAMDMNASFPRMVHDYFPCAKVLYDGFHVIQMFTRNVLAEAKKACQEEVSNRMKEIPKDDTASKENQKTILKRLTSAHWVLVRRNSEMNAKKQKRLDNILADNALLAAIYPITDMLRALWREKDLEEARKLLRDIRLLCYAICRRFNFKPIRNFGDMLKRREEGIVNVGRFGYSSCPLEGANNKIKVLKRTAYGYRDFEYFRLKIFAILPGTRANPYKGLTRGQVVVSGGVLDCCIHAQS